MISQDYVKYILIIFILIIIDLLFKLKNKYIGDSVKNKKYMSHSEYKIAKYLDKLNVKYKMQYTFNNCKDKKMLPFDFAILSDTGKVLLIIEYDGEQHFKPVRFKGQSKKQANENFTICRKHDIIKNNYCGKHNIKLVRIPYTERNNMYKIIYRSLKSEHII